jgi:hypothetical protein
LLHGVVLLGARDVAWLLKDTNFASVLINPQAREARDLSILRVSLS